MLRAEGRVEGINLYPVKSARGESLQNCLIDANGLKGDRRWAIVNGTGIALTIREYPEILQIQALADDGKLTLLHDELGILPIYPTTLKKTRNISVWERNITGYCAGSAASRFITIVIGTEGHLVFVPQGETVPTLKDTLFDDGLILLTNTHSLAEVNRHSPHFIAMERFRPNIIVSGIVAWDEENWSDLTINRLRFRMYQPCSRCVVTTYDPETQQRLCDNEPLRSLHAARQHLARKNVFGVYLVPLDTGPVGVGDILQISR